MRLPAKVARSPLRAIGAAAKGLDAARAAVSMLRPAPPIPAINARISPFRHLATVRRPLADLKAIRANFGTTVNDVVLAASTGGIRRLLEQRAEPTVRLKAMVPVNVRKPGDGRLGQPDLVHVRRPSLRRARPGPAAAARSTGDTVERKSDGESHWVDDILGAIGYFPQPVRDAVSHVMASPLLFNLTVSNIPGPSEPMYMLGCELEEAYPVVPIADGHALSIGVTTIRDQACFGIYADREVLPDADLVAEAINESVNELLALA